MHIRHLQGLQAQYCGYTRALGLWRRGRTYHVNGRWSMLGCLCYRRSNALDQVRAQEGLKSQTKANRRYQQS